MATTSAHAGGITFQINGERIGVEAPRNCNAISCVKVISPGYTGTLGNVDLKGMGSKSKNDDDVVRPHRGGTAQHPLRPRPSRPQPASSRSDSGGARLLLRPPSRAQHLHRPYAGAARSASAARVRPPLCTCTATGSESRCAATDPNSPVGTWSTEENKGNVRIEECGANLCGYSVDTGARILINMKPQESQVDRPDSMIPTAAATTT